MKPQRVYQCMNNNFPRDTTYVSTIGLSQIAGAQFLHVFGPRQWINCGCRPARWLDDPRGASACALPIRRGRSSRCRATTTSSS